MKFILFILFFNINVWASNKVDLCDVLDIPNCKGVSKQLRRNSMGSLPSTSSAANMNPANVSFDRGLGLETIYQPNNNPIFNITTGSGKLGGALISSNVENGFFGNSMVEGLEDFEARHDDKKQFKAKKTTLGIGARAWNNKNFALDAGVILKQHSKIKRVNPGFGLSGRLFFFSFGAAIYQDDLFLFKEAFPTVITGESYSERFIVKTYSAGMRILNLSLDAGIIQSKTKFWKDQTNIAIYSAAYRFDNFLLNIARRSESSNAFAFIDDKAIARQKKNEMFGALQVSLGHFLILGVSYNYFLLRELSFNGTLYY